MYDRGNEKVYSSIPFINKMITFSEANIIRRPAMTIIIKLSIADNSILKSGKTVMLLMNVIYGKAIARISIPLLILEELWTKANLHEEGGKWRKIGFATEAQNGKFIKVEYLELKNMHKFMKKMLMIIERQRCPFAKTSIEATELLCDYCECKYNNITIISNHLSDYGMKWKR
ncbi:hypothetical protein RhiirA5_415322 [Rhizophagus irregularis]|uniref:ELMO domain-containing protein n=1 Tax=Rhizophagus irregularis TaxID=588596 RepID=A0A2N0PS80_9GLOM|nr:hypothetical protein RhiirA5_415322 [Rhizophagus irregularis]